MYRIDLNPEEIPKKWYNINADLPYKVPEAKNSEGKNQLKDLKTSFTKEALKQENSKKRYIPIPKEVREAYMEIGRATPITRAKRLEEKLNTPAKIYLKREDLTPTGSHKINSAIPQAYYAKKENIERLTTETGAGQWGTALSLACNMYDIDCTVYMVRGTLAIKKLRENIIRLYGGDLIPSPSTNTDVGSKILKKDPDHPGSLGIAISEAMEEALKYENVKYALGSVLNHVLLHQTIIGQEIATQMEIADREIDTIIGCTGGGSNFGGATFPFMKDKIKGNSDIEFIAAEPASCPTLTKGRYEYDSGDINASAPLLKMYTLGKDFIPPNRHAGGLRYHGMNPQVSLLKKENYIKARALPQNETFEAGVMLSKCEGILPAPETCHALKVAIDEAVKCKETKESKNIVVCYSGHGLLDLAGYEKYLSGELN